MKKIKFLLAIVFLGVTWFSNKEKIFAATAGRSCSSPGSIECCGSARCQCKFVGAVYMWVNIGNCTYGCSGSSCLPAPTAIPTPTPACRSNNCSGCTSASPCSSIGCYWETQLGVCTNNFPTPTPVCRSSNCGGCGTVTTCSNAGCRWSYATGCTNTECDSGAKYCSSTFTLRTCVNNSWTNSDCPTGYTCSNGVCNPPVPIECTCGDPGLVGEQCVTGYAGNLHYSESGGATWTCSPNGTCDVKKECQTSTFTNACESWGGECAPGIGSCNGTIGSSTENYTCRLITSNSGSVCCKPDVACSQAVQTYLGSNWIGSCTPTFSCSGVTVESSGSCFGEVCCAVGQTCDVKYPGSSCQDDFYCRDTDKNKNAVDCAVSSKTCCSTLLVGECVNTDFCQAKYNNCYECVNPGTPLSKCEPTKTTGICGSPISCTRGNVSIQENISNSSGISQAWTCSGTCITSASCSYNCSAVNGVCGTTTGTCSAGTPSAVGTSNVSTIEGQTGKLNLWNCNGSCNGSNDIGCNSYNCTNGEVTDGACKSVASLEDVANHTLCVQGEESNVNTTEAEITWDCLGSTSVCAERDGTDALNCHSDVDQINWFQVNDGNVLAKGKVNNYVPITTRVGGSTNLTSTVVNGKVYSRLASSLSDYDQSVVDKSENSSFNFKTYNYSQIKTDYFDKKGIGTVFTANDGWSTIKETTGIIFVDGDLIIDSNLVTTNFVMIIAKGTITIEPTVTRIDAILLGNRVIAAAADDSVESVAQLVINGMVHGVTSVEFSRSLVPKSGNNTSPSVVVNYKPELLFMVPEKLAKAFSQWKVK